MRFIDIRENAITVELEWQDAEELAEGLRRAAEHSDEGGEAHPEHARRAFYFALMMALQAAALASRIIPDAVDRDRTEDRYQRLVAQWAHLRPPSWQRRHRPPAA
jgi:hypothetical protein